jgi:hypothetical protein
MRMHPFQHGLSYSCPISDGIRKQHELRYLFIALRKSLLFSLRHRSGLWKVLQLDLAQPSRLKPSFCAFGSQVHRC